ncbi:hypothetical protein MW887_005909 [Aspergillus wentii]|nr:hypothetical protein MW887_005909 [Aspergillus wentii]
MASHSPPLLLSSKDIQIPLGHQDGTSQSCYPIWDSANAQLLPCAMPYIAIIPAAVILVVGIVYVLGPLFHRWRPEWTKQFISEEPSAYPELPPEKTKQRLGWIITLFALSIIGIAAEAVQLISPGLNPTSIILLSSWAATALVIVAKRPRTCPNLMLVYFITVFVVELFLIINDDIRPKFKAVGHYVAISASVAALLTILLMPMRKPCLPCEKIGAVGQVPSSDFRSPEDNLRLWQFLSVSWMAPLISLGRMRQLDEEDVWFLGFEFQHHRLHEKFRKLRGSVIRRLLQANGIDVTIVILISTVQMLCDFSTPVLLQQLLQAMSDPRRPKRVPLTYAFLALLLRFVAAQCQVLNLWYGRRSYERSRGEMIMMVYEKALSRKNIFGVQVNGGKEESRDEAVEAMNDNANPEMETNKSKRKRLFGFIPRKRMANKGNKEKPREAASMGKIFNLLRGDVYEVAQRFWEVDSLVDKPIGLIIAVVLVWKLFGPSCFLGVIAVLIAQIVNALITRILLGWERIRRTATDARLQISSQFVEALRHLRWYGWQNHWLRQVMEARQSELNLRIITSSWTILIRFINAFASGVFPVLALYAYTLLAGHPLRVDIIFPALQLFTMLETRLRDIPSLITVLINASVAVERIEDFMSEPDKEAKAPQSHQDPSPFEMESCSFAWPGIVVPVISDISLTIPQGLTVVCGKVGAGKTALLQALLGELDTTSGLCHIPNEMIGYCAQTPWLQSMSIRDNILFSSPYDEQRYKRVLDACALLPDLSNFKHGDLSFVGENGIGLSGGQKARVALARAMYSAARILLLDDPISALDQNTAEIVVRKCFSGPLMQDRTVVLVTHRTAMVRSFATQMVDIHDGQATLYDRDALSSNASAHEIEHEPHPEIDESEFQNTTNLDESSAVPDKFIEEEHRAEWGVQTRVYWNYIKSGKYRWWAVLILILTVHRLTSIGQSWFLKEWGEAYNQVILKFQYAGSSGNTLISEWTKQPALSEASNFDTSSIPNNPIDLLPSPQDDVRPWILAFFVIASFQSVTLLIAQILMVVIVYCAGKTLFRQVMERVSHATFRFFDVTPIGRLMNRLTSDIGVVDGNISEQFQMIAFQAITWISSILVIASVTPSFLAFSLVFTAAFVIVFLHFLPTSQSLRRLEMVSLSPLLSNFGELLHGLTTVRAFRAESRFQSRVIEVVDKFQGMDHFYWSLQSWLMYRFETLSGLSIFCLTALALYTNVSPGLAAFALIAANNFVTSTHALCKQYGQLQMDFVSVERIDELLHIEQETAGTIEPPASWPRFGQDITFEDVTIRYAPQLEPSLTDVSLRIPGGSTTAIIGRTGSGKSTLAVSLLSVIRPESGRIIVDGIDIAKVSTQALRTRVTFVAQDPVLFPGSIRLNLDPTEEYSEEECSDVLDRICSRHGWNLETHIEAGGRNLSQGQRQLIGLTRAVLRRSPIVILDEATASIDHETSLEIQQIIREEMRESTVITIAHRLEAIKDAEYYIVLDHGRASQQGYVNESS